MECSQISPRNFDNKVTDVSQLNLEADESKMIVCYTTSTTNDEETAEGNVDETEENDSTEQDGQCVHIVEFPLNDLDRKLHRRIRMRLADSCAELNKSKEQTGLRSYFTKTRLAMDLDAHLSSAEYVQKVIQQEVQVLHDVNCSTSIRVSSHDTTHRSMSPSIDDNTTSITSNFDNQETNDWQESANTPVLADSVLNSNFFVATDNENSTDDSASANMTRHNNADLLDLPGHQTSSTLLSHANASAEWMFKGTNISTLFMIFQQKVVDITVSALLHMEASIHEALALSHVFLLAPQQHSQLTIDVFTEEILDALTENLVHESLKLKLDTGVVICGKVFRIIDSVQMHQLDNDEANVQLLQLCGHVDKHTSCVICGIAYAMGELPLQAIKNKQSISEYELPTTYFHPILSCILSSPEKRVLLRWTNIESDSSGDKRPDATLTKLIQLSYGPSLSFGEAKVAKPTTNNNDLCHDLLRLGIFCKEAIDTHHWNACLAFQIHGFAIVFYLMRLRHDGIYTMYEIAKVLLPRSLEELSSFISLKNLRSLAQVSESFWQLCKSVPASEIGVMISNSRPTHPCFYNLIDSSKNKSRTCALRFEQ
ncbi:hypothetical protein G6F43_011744 [Rhizopus delemar]|nr:hypothetical protein G6F43_011744 [Rhizopus delemar]